MKQLSIIPILVPLAGVLCLLAYCGQVRADDGGEVLDLHTCLEQAMVNHPDLEALRQQVEMKENERKSVRGHFLPVVKVEGKVLGFDDSFSLPVDLSGVTGILDTLFESFGPLISDEVKEQVAAFKEKGLAMELRDNVVYGVSATVAQPLGQLFTVYAGHSAAKAMAEAARNDQEVLRKTIQGQVVEAYLGLLTAMRLEETVKAALAQLDAYEAQVEGYVTAELVERNALLKVRVAKADYQRKAIAAANARKLASAALNLYRGKALDTPFTPVEIQRLPRLDGMDDLTPQQQGDKALALRPELVSARHQRDAAHWGKMAAIGKMLPDLNLIARYEYLHGAYGLQPEQEFFGGLVLSWDVWTWGSDYYHMRSYESLERKANAAIAAGEKKVRLELKAKALAMEKADQDTLVADAEEEQAAENLRIVELSYQAREATTTELLEAQTLVTKARNQQTIALHHRTRAALDLALAMGQDLLAVVK